MRPMISTADVAKVLGITPVSVRSLIEAGQLPAYRVGRVIKVRPEDEAFLDRHRV
jgi:excisionase family DNA binding protein